MLDHGLQRVGLSEADLDFVVREAAPDAANADHLKRLIREDEAFRRALVGDERVFARVMTDEEIFLRISPALYFEVLLRRAWSTWSRPSTPWSTTRPGPSPCSTPQTWWSCLPDAAWWATSRTCSPPSPAFGSP